MTPTAADMAPAPDDMKGSTGKAYNASELITMACHGIANTTFTPSDPKPKWFDALDKELQGAIALADQWINDLGPQVTSTIPLQVINFGPTFTATTEEVLRIAHAHPDARGRDNKHVVAIRELISEALVPSLGQSLTNIDEAAKDLTVWGKKVQASHDALSSGATDIQNLELDLQKDIGDMNRAIDRLKKTINAENKAVAYSAGAIGIGVFALVVGIALAPVTGGVSLLIGGFIGAAGIIGGSVTWGVMQHRIDQQFDQIAADQKKKAADQRQLVALGGLSLASDSAVHNLDLASKSLSTLRTQWSVFGGELQGVIEKLDNAEESLSTAVQGVFTDAARGEWKEATDSANSLANRKIEIDAKTLSMDGQAA